MTITGRAVVAVILSTQKFVSLNKQTKLHSLYRSSKPLTPVVFLYEQQQGRLFTDDAVCDASVAWVVQCCGFSCSQLLRFHPYRASNELCLLALYKKEAVSLILSAASVDLTLL